MRNERGAGRKAIVSNEQLNIIIERIAGGESVSALAEEVGVSRQALYKRLRVYQGAMSASLDYVVDGDKIAELSIDMQNENVAMKETCSRAITYYLGINHVANWQELSLLLEKEYFKAQGIDVEDLTVKYLSTDFGKKTFSLNEVLQGDNDIQPSDKETISAIDSKNMPCFEFTKKDILLARTDTDGYQYKALSHNRRWFVKAQVSMGGIAMNDWAVEVIASSLCEKLAIPCVKQNRCEFMYEGIALHGCYSANFELKGYSFISFESLIMKIGKSTNDSEFIRMDTISKLEWCAQMLAELGKLDYASTLKYMIDLALIDCLVGNVDRHTRNFGLFYDSIEGKYIIPYAFDNGMGLFEHDYYRDRYESYDAAMRNVYVSPYGEDPFDMILLLDEEYDLLARYPELTKLNYGMDKMIYEWGHLTENARYYALKMKEQVDKICQK